MSLRPLAAHGWPWRSLAAAGCSCRLLAPNATLGGSSLCGSLAAPGGLWWLAALGEPCGLLAVPGGPWRPLAAPGGPWGPLAAPASPWRLLLAPGCLPTAPGCLGGKQFGKPQKVAWKPVWKTFKSGAGSSVNNCVKNILKKLPSFGNIKARSCQISIFRLFSTRCSQSVSHRESVDASRLFTRFHNGF